MTFDETFEILEPKSPLELASPFLYSIQGFASKGYGEEVNDIVDMLNDYSVALGLTNPEYMVSTFLAYQVDQVDQVAEHARFTFNTAKSIYDFMFYGAFKKFVFINAGKLALSETIEDKQELYTGATNDSGKFEIDEQGRAVILQASQSTLISELCMTFDVVGAPRAVDIEEPDNVVIPFLAVDKIKPLAA